MGIPILGKDGLNIETGLWKLKFYPMNYAIKYALAWCSAFIPILQLCSPWSMGMDKLLHLALYNGCHYLFMLVSKLTMSVKGAPGVEARIFQAIWLCHQMETFSALLALCAVNSPVTGESVAGEFHSEMQVLCSFDVFVDLRLNKRLSKQPRCRWLETPSRSLWRHGNETRTIT